MIFPYIKGTKTSQEFIENFKGYNHNPRISENEFYDMENLTSDNYPLISPRKKRGKFLTSNNKIVGMIEKDALCYVTVDNNKKMSFFMNKMEYSLGTTTYPKEVERKLTSMGAYVIIMPDKKYINTIKPDEKGNIEAKFTTNGQVTFNICRQDGTSYTADSTGPNEPAKEVLKNGYVWLDTSSKPYSLKIYSEATGMWNPVLTTYIKIGATDIGLNFKADDGVEISGITVQGLEILNNTMVINSIAKDYITVVGILPDDMEKTQDTPVTVARTMPDMDFLIESHNRLWGCHYGESKDKTKIVNELYACKLGDFKNWNCFTGISTDSYRVSLGTDGQFTGAYTYLGNPIFFKENCLHTVYGNFPAEYRVRDTACRGVQKGSEDSLAMLNEMLYYKSRTGVCVYNGSLPEEISYPLGKADYSNAIAYAYRGKYYISMQQTDNKKVLFIFDSEKNMWHKENDPGITKFCAVKDELYYLTDGMNIYSMFGSGVAEKEPVKWKCETGLIGVREPNKKYISRFTIRLKLRLNSRIRIFAQYDSSEEWEQIGIIEGTTLETFNLNVRPKRCDHMRLKMIGIGEAKIFSILKVIEVGSNI